MRSVAGVIFCTKTNVCSEIFFGNGVAKIARDFFGGNGLQHALCVGEDENHACNSGKERNGCGK